jgi:hypothetical protein
MNLIETIRLRRELWEKCRPWTEGLGTLFDATQEELFFQSAALPEDGRRAESRFMSLSEFERIVFAHLVDMRQGCTNSRSFGHQAWMALLSDLDKKKIFLDDELRGQSKQVLDEIRRNRHEVVTWTQAYDGKLSCSLEDGRTYTLRREVTHALQNVAKKATYKLAKVWNVGQ